MNTQKRKRVLRLAVLVTTVCILAGGWLSFQAGRSSAAPSVKPAVIAQVLNVNCPSADVNIGSTYTKIQDIDVFTVQSTDSLVEITFNGRLHAGLRVVRRHGVG